MSILLGQQVEWPLQINYEIDLFETVEWVNHGRYITGMISVVGIHRLRQPENTSPPSFQGFSYMQHLCQYYGGHLVSLFF